MYTLRLDSGSFHANKGQRQALNAFNKHVLSESYIKSMAVLYPVSREMARKRNNEFDLVERIHESEVQYLNHFNDPAEPNLAMKKKPKRAPEPAHKLVITLESDDFTEEKYGLYEHYQRIVHKEPPSKISRSGFKNFLCSSPLSRSTRKIEGQDRKLGSYHQCYRLDGELVAIGVLDLLPTCVSAVYFMYHNSVSRFSLGKIGALREIALAKEKGYRWWYSGFYIHGCVKMKYKGEFEPQYILDPESYSWDLFDDKFKKRLDEDTYVSLSSMEKRKSKDGTEEGPGYTKTDKKTGLEDELDTSNADSDDEPPVPDAHLPIFSRSPAVPGILTKQQLLGVDLDNIPIKVYGQEAVTQNLVGWDEQIDDPHTFKGMIAELVAAIGVEAASRIVVEIR